MSNFTPARFYVKGTKMIIGNDAANTVIINNGSGWSVHSVTELSSCFIDNNDRYWICGNGYVSEYDGNQWTKFTRYNTGLAEYSNRDLFIDSKNRKWFANGNGGIQNLDCPEWEAYGPLNEGHFPSLQNLSTVGSSVTEDSNGNIWMTYDAVLGYAIKIDQGNYSDPANWHLYDNSNVGPDFQALAEVESTGTGLVFFRTSYNKIFIHDQAAGTWTMLTNPTGNNPTPRCMSADADGKMYIGGYETITVYDNGNWSDISLSSLGATGYVNDIAFDQSGNMWIGTQAGAWKYNGSAWTNYNRANSGIAADHVEAIEIGNGKVYLGAFNVTTFPYYGGISIYDGTAWTHNLQGSSGLPHKQVEDLQLDTFGNLWVLSQTEAIAVYNPAGVEGAACFNQNLVVLPVTLTDFRAYRRNNTAEIRWTVSEANASRYEVEKSADAASFQQLIALQAAGNGIHSYNTTDRQPRPGNNFYRLKMIDLDGHITYSDIAKVFFGAEPAINFYVHPNPVTGKSFMLEYNNSDAGYQQLQMIDFNGKIVLNQESRLPAGNGSYPVNLHAGMSTGVYTLRIAGRSNTIIIKLMIK